MIRVEIGSAPKNERWGESLDRTLELKAHTQIPPPPSLLSPTFIFWCQAWKEPLGGVEIIA